MIGRRAVLLASVAAVMGSSATAHELPRIALVDQGKPVENMAIGRHPSWGPLLDALHDLGRIEGQTVTIDRWTLDDHTPEQHS